MLIALALAVAAALRPPPPALRPPPPALSRRATIGAFAAAAFSPLASFADMNALDAAGGGGKLQEGGALGATCLGFGCNPYGDTSFNGMPASQAAPGSMPYPEFLQALKDKKVEGVVFQPPSGDIAYAIIEGKSVRMGEGWPVEISNSWSSPTWVVRILENEGVPYAWNFDLKKKKRFADGTAGAPKAYEPFVPKPVVNGFTGGQPFEPAPKTYGGADNALDRDLYDYANNGIGPKPK